MTTRKLLPLGATALAILAAVVLGWRIVDTRAQAVLQARHPKPESAIAAATGPDAVAAGRRLAVISGCTLCHGEAMTGPVAGGPAARFRAPNLTLVAAHRSDADLDRAMRAALNPDGTSELAMPSYAYRELGDAETSQLLAYLRALAPQGRAYQPPPPGALARLSAALGRFRTQWDRLAQAKPALDAGPQLAAGRHLAAIACGQCHGRDLAGGEGLPGPDLTVRGFYTRAQFHELMRSGQMPQNVHSELMQEAARASLHALDVGEVDAIYDYLVARDAGLSKQRPQSAS
jgi:mono/diheme cytochrome c family protein